MVEEDEKLPYIPRDKKGRKIVKKVLTMGEWCDNIIKLSREGLLRTRNGRPAREGQQNFLEKKQLTKARGHDIIIKLSTRV
ncbi:MAG: hypothetical protein IKV41_00770, partial [Oscillospiraceae bacterium]|nr:hypothetical protein [Oscillospiraceae bacterium]